MAEKRKRRRPRPIVAAFRVDASRRLVAVLLTGAALVLGGSILSAAGMLIAHGHAPLGRVAPLHAVTDAAGNPLPAVSLLELWPGMLGLVLVVTGALFSIVALRRVLGEEDYLALRKDGALFVRRGEKRLLLWADVEDVRAEGGRVVFHLHDGEVTELDAVFSGFSIDDVVRTAREVRRKALFGLLR